MCLCLLLQAYSVYDEEIGYCQGQSFLAAVLLLHVSSHISRVQQKSKLFKQFKKLRGTVLFSCDIGILMTFYNTGGLAWFILNVLNPVGCIFIIGNKRYDVEFLHKGRMMVINMSNNVILCTLLALLPKPFSQIKSCPVTCVVHTGDSVSDAFSPTVNTPFGLGLGRVCRGRQDMT